MKKSEKPKPAPVVIAKYETKGTDAQRVEVYIRPSAHRSGWFTFWNSLDNRDEHQTKQKIVKRLVSFDKSLTMRGYVRMNFSNLSGDSDFNL